LNQKILKQIPDNAEHQQGVKIVLKQKNADETGDEMFETF
jgi:hypothetical protein